MDYARLIHALKRPPPLKTPIILPDFFLDHFVIVDELERFIEGLQQLAAQGGGNLIGSRHLVRRGGNSVNTASALLNLGVNPYLILKTDTQGLSLLRGLVSPSMDLSHVKDDGRMASTVSIEASHQGRRVNLMVSDSGSVADFAFSDLTENDLKAMRNAGLVALLCLNHNRNAPGLASNVFTYLRENSKAHTFMDMGDPSSHPDIVPELAKQVIQAGLVDTVSMNENEAGWFARALSPQDARWEDVVHHEERWLDAASFVSRETGVRVDLHTPHFTASIREQQITVVPTFLAVPRVVCGSGDSWNAGDIYGILSGMEDRDRLTLANSVAALYISSEEAKQPSVSDIEIFLERKPRLS